MAPKPTVEFRWADGGLAPNINIPDAERLGNGWGEFDVPTASWQNYCMNAQGQWIEYFDGEVDELKDGGIVTTFYLRPTTDLVTGIGSTYTCKSIANAGTGTVLLVLPEILISEFPESATPCYLAPSDIAGVLTGAWESSLPSGTTVSVSSRPSTPGDDISTRKYLSYTQSGGGVYLIRNADFSNYVGVTTSTRITAGTYNAV